MGRLLKITAVVVISVILGLIIYLWVADLGRFKPYIEDKVTEVTGRVFTIDGELSIRVLPTPTLDARDIRMAGPHWSEQGDMLTVSHVHGQVGLWSLLFKPIEIEDFRLSDVAVLVETNSEGELNWQMGEPQQVPEEPEEGEAEFSFPLDIEHAQIDNVTVNYVAPDAESMEFVLQSLSLEEAGDQIEMQTAARFNEIPLAAQGNISNVQAILDASVSDIAISAQLDYPDDSVGFSTSIQTLAKVGALLEIENLPDQELSIQGAVSVDGQTLQLADIVVLLGGIELILNGQLDAEQSRATINAAISGNSLAEIQPTLPEISYALQTDLVAEQQTLRLAPFSLQFGDSLIEGEARLEGGELPSVELTMNSEAVDLSPFLQHEADTEPAGPVAEEKTPDSEQPASDNEQAYVFVDEHLPFEQLQTLNLNVKAEIGKVVTPNSEINNFALDTQLEGGVLDLITRFDGQYSGNYHSEVNLNAAQSPAQFQVKSTVDAFKLGALSGSGVAEEDIPDTNLELDIQSSGASPRQLASQLNGRVLLQQGAGKVRNDLIEKFSGDILAQLFSALNPFAEQEEFTNWECSVFALDFESGLGEISGFLLQSEKLMVVGGGEVDLNDESLKIEFNTKPRKGVGVSADMFVTPFVELSGTLAAPSVGLNEKGALLAGGAAILTGGMSFLYTGLMDRATAEGGRCEEVMAEINQQAPADEPSPDSEPQSP